MNYLIESSRCQPVLMSVALSVHLEFTLKFRCDKIKIEHYGEDVGKEKLLYMLKHNMEFKQPLSIVFTDQDSNIITRFKLFEKKIDFDFIVGNTYLASYKQTLPPITFNLFQFFTELFEEYDKYTTPCCPNT